MSVVAPENIAMKRWLAIIGIGEGGVEELTPAARALLAQASLVVGGERHLSLVGTVDAEHLAWPSPLTDAIEKIIVRRGQPVVVLASGDPFFYGVGDLLARHIAIDEIQAIPSPSAFALAASRLCWSQQDCTLLSLHGRTFERITPHLQPGRRIIALSWDQTTPSRIAVHLSKLGFGSSRIHVLEHLGGARERMRSTAACEFAMDDVAALNTVGIEIEAKPDARVIALTSGLPDDYFEHDGQITKRGDSRRHARRSRAETGRVAVGYRRRLRIGLH